MGREKIRTRAQTTHKHEARQWVTARINKHIRYQHMRHNGRECEQRAGWQHKYTVSDGGKSVQQACGCHAGMRRAQHRVTDHSGVT